MNENIILQAAVETTEAVVETVTVETTEVMAEGVFKRALGFACTNPGKTAAAALAAAAVGYGAYRAVKWYNKGRQTQGK